MTISTSSPDNQHFHVFFGGPDCRPRSLHDLLYSHVSAVPAGGEIFWATYYFRDKALADALIQAKNGGSRSSLPWKRIRAVTMSTSLCWRCCNVQPILAVIAER